MQEFSHKLEKRFDWARDMDIVGMVSEFAAGVIKELDYRNEAYHMLRLADNMSAVPGVTSPSCTSSSAQARVLTMEFVVGVKITKTREMDEAGLDRVAVGQ